MEEPHGWSELDVDLGLDFATYGAPVPLAARIFACFQDVDLAAHPFFVALAGGPVVDLESVYLLLANLHRGTSGVLVSYLARAIQRADDCRVASLLARRLNVELGGGDFTQIDGVHLERLIAALSPWCDRAGDHMLMRAGKRLVREGARPFYAPHPHEALGALIVREIFVEKMAICLASEMRRQMLVTGESMRWLHLRESMAASQAEDARALAVLLPPAGYGLAAAWRGALDHWDDLWQLLDDVHELRENLRAQL